MWDVEAIVKAGLAIGTPLATVVGLSGRRGRLRREIRENLALVDEVEKHAPLRDASLASAWLQGRVALDVARLTGQEVGSRKRPVPWGSVVLAALIAGVFGLWTYWLIRDEFVWYAVFPGAAAALFVAGTWGMFLNREIASGEDSLPPGAVRARTETATERVATAVTLEALGGLDDRYAPGGQVDVVFTFAKLLQLGAYEPAIQLAEDNWIQCRVNAWLWKNRSVLGDDQDELEKLAARMLALRSESDEWQAFVDTEARQFAAAWGGINFDEYGTAGNRRRIAQDLDLVLLLPVGSEGGYFVMSAMAIPNAMPFLVRRYGQTWRIANHAGQAVPVPAWPPIWWVTDDPDIQALPEPS